MFSFQAVIPRSSVLFLNTGSTAEILQSLDRFAWDTHCWTCNPMYQWSQNCWLEIFPFLYLSAFNYLHYYSFNYDNFLFHNFVPTHAVCLILSSLAQLSTLQTEAMYSLISRVHKPLCTDSDSGRSSFICYLSLPLTVFHASNIFCTNTLCFNFSVQGMQFNNPLH